MYWLKDWRDCPRISCVYKIICTKNKKYYIGSTIDIRNRMYEHLLMLKKDKHHSNKVQNTYNKYGLQFFQVHILVECKHDECKKIEQKWLDEYFGRKDCLNERPDAEGGRTKIVPVVQYSIKTGHPLRAYQSIVDAEEITNIPAKNIGGVCRGIKKSSGGYIWRYLSDNIDKIDVSSLYKNKNIHHLDIIKRKRSIIQYSKKTGHPLRRWPSIAEASKTLGISRHRISEVCSGYTTINSNGTLCKSVSAGGYIWRYEDDNIDKIDISSLYEKKRKPQAKQVVKYNKVTGQLIEKYESSGIAAKQNGFPQSSISIACRKSKLYKGYHWKYI